MSYIPLVTQGDPPSANSHEFILWTTYQKQHGLCEWYVCTRNLKIKPAGTISFLLPNTSILEHPHCRKKKTKHHRTSHYIDETDFIFWSKCFIQHKFLCTNAFKAEVKYIFRWRSALKIDIIVMEHYQARYTLPGSQLLACLVDPQIQYLKTMLPQLVRHPLWITFCLISKHKGMLHLQNILMVIWN